MHAIRLCSSMEFCAIMVSLSHDADLIKKAEGESRGRLKIAKSEPNSCVASPCRVYRKGSISCHRHTDRECRVSVLACRPDAEEGEMTRTRAAAKFTRKYRRLFWRDPPAALSQFACSTCPARRVPGVHHPRGALAGMRLRRPKGDGINSVLQRPRGSDGYETSTPQRRRNQLRPTKTAGLWRVRDLDTAN